jgi:aldose 1-epimerase
MITLRAGAAEAIVLPDRGAAVARLLHQGRDLVVPVPAGADPNRGLHGAFLMAPWTNRLDGGRIVVGGVEHRMPVNRPDEGNALHGFLRELPWSVADSAADSLLLTCDFDHAPFRGTGRFAIRLAEDHLRLELRLTNTASAPTPMGIGWHPYFPRPDGTRLHARATTVFGRDPRNLPIAPRPSAGLAGGQAVLDGLDTHFAGWDGAAALTWPDGRSLHLAASGAWATNLQVYAPRGTGVIAVEPVSHAPDAPNRATSAAHGALCSVAPQHALDSSLMIHWH